jgi:hypothetical protein
LLNTDEKELGLAVCSEFKEETENESTSTEPSFVVMDLGFRLRP